MIGQYQDPVVKIAIHPEYQGIDYGSRKKKQENANERRNTKITRRNQKLLLNYFRNLS